MSKFVKCGPDLTVNRDDVASLNWDRADAWRGGDSYLTITLNSGVQHRIRHQNYGYGGVDCYEIEKAIINA